MKRLSLGLLLLGWTVAFAQDPGENPPIRAQAAAEDFRHWTDRVPLTFPPAASGQYVRVPLSPALYGKALPSLQDVRLATEDNRVLPYAVVTLNGETEQAVRDGRTFDRVTLPDRSERLSVDLGERPGEHNEILLDVQARSYGRSVLVETSDEGNRYAKLFEGELIYLTVAGQTIDQRRFTYSPSRSRYLRVTLGRDRVETNMGTVLRDVQIRYRITRPAQTQRGQVVSRLQREPVRVDGEAGSAWNLTLPDRLPVSTLRFRVPAQKIERPWRLETILESNPYWESPRQLIANGILRREADAPEELITLHFPETHARQLRLTIQDARNAPLEIQEMEYELITRLLVFQAPPAAKNLFAYVGNADAPPPRYEMTLPADIVRLPEGVAGARMQNPRYEPPPPPVEAWTERNRWLIDATTLIALAVLAALLTQMALSNLRAVGSGLKPKTGEE